MDMDLKYRVATINDLDVLVETRIRVLRAANQLSDAIDLSVVARESRFYYIQSLMDNSHIAYLVYDADKIVGAGGVSFYRVLPTVHNASGEKAYIMNMYTDPEYRRQGIGWEILDYLVDASKAKGISFITLEATKIGKPLYQKYGFVQMNDEMYLPNITTSICE